VGKFVVCVNRRWLIVWLLQVIYTPNYSELFWSAVDKLFVDYDDKIRGWRL